jgi:hypothetical protein
MSRYPQVIDEFETLRRVVAGESIARYGDGEFKMADRLSANIKSQNNDLLLHRRLGEILHESGDCMVGIPNIRSETPKVEFWGRHLIYASLLKAERPYVSSFITRPDSAPWINTPEYWALLESLWVGQDVTLVRGSGKSFTAERLVAAGAGNVTEIMAPRQQAWAEYESLLERIGTPKRALLCLGPTATVMAVDLCARGVHAIDAGHAGMMYNKHILGLPMWVTKEEKDVDRLRGGLVS